MKIAVIGAGIYGCHLALSLKKQGCEVDLYDMSQDLFSGASTNNSCRIHKGYHYPRSSKTREMCKRDELEFVRCYPQLISPAQNNPKLFCVANDERTLIDFNTLKAIMSASELPFEELSLDTLSKLGFTNIEGGFKTYEPIFFVDKAKDWFKENLIKQGVNLKLNSYLDNIHSISPTQIDLAGFKYDFVINSTYNQAFQYVPIRHHCYFDLCFYLIVASKKKKNEINYCSFGIFDGAYPSLEPFGYDIIPQEYASYCDRQLFQLFHVKYTSIQQFSDIQVARNVLYTGLSEHDLHLATKHIVEDTLNFYPAFNEEFEIIGHNLALKTKVAALSDERPLLVCRDFTRHPHFIQVFSSKLTSIFSAEKEINNLLNLDIDCDNVGNTAINF